MPWWSPSNIIDKLLPGVMPEMKCFSNARAKRNSAFVVLLAWLFALWSGFANACLLEAPDAHSHGATRSSETTPSHAATEHHSHAGTDHHSGATADHHSGAVANHGDDAGGNNADVPRAPCLKVCDEGSRSLTTQRSDAERADHATAPAIAVLWSVPARVVSVSFSRVRPAIPCAGTSIPGAVFATDAIAVL